RAGLGKALEEFYEPEPMSGCWIWTGQRTPLGYGQYSVSRGPGMPSLTRGAHVVMYESLRGPVPEGLELDHTCRMPSCVNPNHLDAITHRENILRGNTVCAANAKKISAPCGHAYDWI